MELGSLESPSPKPHFRPWKAIFDHKKSTFDHFEPFSNHQVSSVCHFRLWSSDSQWFKLIQTESKSRVRKPEFPKIKTNKIFHAFNLPFCQFFDAHSEFSSTPKVKWTTWSKTGPGDSIWWTKFLINFGIFLKKIIKLKSRFGEHRWSFLD